MKSEPLLSCDFHSADSHIQTAAQQHGHTLNRVNPDSVVVKLRPECGTILFLLKIEIRQQNPSPVC